MAKTKYSGTIIVLDNKLSTFGADRSSLECMKIFKNGKVTVVGTSFENINKETSCVPVRLTLDPKDESQDWTKYGSPIEEISFGNIVRYFPISTFKFDKSNKKETITLSYPDFEIDLQVAYESQPVDNTVYTEPESKEDNIMCENETVESVVETVEATAVEQKKKLPKWAIGAAIGAAVVTTAAIVTGVILKNKNKDKDCGECTEEVAE